MDDLRTSLLARIDRGLDAMATAPRMFGSPESLESQALLLLEFRCMVLRPHLTLKNPGEMEEAYEKYVGGAFADAPATMLAYILKGQGKQSELPEYMQRFRGQIEKDLPEENAYEHNDMVLDIEIRADRDIPSFSKICGYYERFMRAFRAIVRRGPKDESDAKDAMAKATEYPIPEIRVFPGENGGTRIRIPLEQPRFGQLSFEREFLSEQRAREAIRQAMDVVSWAEEVEPDMGNLRTLFPSNKQRKALAAHTIRMLPQEGIESVRVGGKLLGGGAIELRPSQAPKIVPVLEDGEDPETFSVTGIVRAVDRDQKWFRLKYRNTTRKCWVSNAEYLELACKALADKVKVTVDGDEFSVAYRRPFVQTHSLVLAA